MKNKKQTNKNSAGHLRPPAFNLWSQKRDSVFTVPEEIQKMTRSHPSASSRLGSGERVKFVIITFCPPSSGTKCFHAAPWLFSTSCQGALLTSSSSEAAPKLPFPSALLPTSFTQRLSLSALGKLETNLTWLTHHQVGATTDTDEITKYILTFGKEDAGRLNRVQALPFSQAILWERVAISGTHHIYLHHKVTSCFVYTYTL